MIEFYDNESNLTFKCYNGMDSRTHYYREDDYYQYVLEMNSWSDQGIKDFVVEGTPLGNFFNWNNLFMNEHEHLGGQLVFALDGDILIGCALLTTENPSIAFSLDPANTKLFPALIDKKPKVNIDFIATNPHLRNLGYGTRFIKGIKNNEKILTNEKESSGITANVREDNQPSKKAFLKNDFIIVHKGNLIKTLGNYHTLYFGKHNQILKQ